MTITPLISNSTISSQSNVIPQVGSKRLNQTSQVNFSSHGSGGEEKESSHWFLKTLLVLAGGYVAYRFLKNPVKNIIKDFGKDNFVDLFKKAEKKETFAWRDVEEHMRSLHKSNKSIERGFLLRLTDNQRTIFGVVPNEGIALGYKVGEHHVVTKAVVCDKLDDKFLKKLGNDYYYQFA